MEFEQKELRDLVHDQITLHDRRFGRKVGLAELIRTAMKAAYVLGKVHTRRQIAGRAIYKLKREIED